MHSSHLSNLLFQLSPDLTVCLAALGVGLIFLELNRPGRILPGAAGLALFLLAGASLAQHGLRPAGLLLLLLSAGLMALHLRLAMPPWFAAVPAVVLVGGIRFLLPGTSPEHIHLRVALTCGLLVGLPGTALSRIALRARRLKAVH